MTSEKTFTSKLGTTRAGPRSRIWLEGQRLIDAGFTPGYHYDAIWTERTLTLIVGEAAVRAVPSNVECLEQRKVSGKAAKPIIDIVGARVLATFGERAERVSVAYGAGVITIRAEAA
jgi:hypothetical protein